MYNRYIKGADELQDSKMLQNQPFVLVTATPSLQNILQAGLAIGKYVFTGDENIIIKDSGSTVTVWVDSLAFVERTYQIQGGYITKIA